MKMNLKRYKPYIHGILLCEAVGFLSGLLTREGTQWFNTYANQPPLSPPAVVFPIAWGLIYALMGIGIARIWLHPDSVQRSKAINAFVSQLILNFFWSLIFFNAKAYGLAVIWIIILWITVLVMILRYHKLDSIAAWLQIPYLIWLTFAAYLALGVWLLN